MPWPTYKTQEEIPEAFRSEYEQKGDEWVAKIPDVAGATSALEKERQRARDEGKARKAAEKERDELKRSQEARDKGISEEELQKIRDAEAAARRPIEEERDRLAAENRKLKLTDRVQALALKHGVMSDRIEDAMLLLDRRTDLTDQGGIAVKDKDGNITAQTIDDFLAKTFKAEKPWLYAGSGASGSGAEGSRGSGGPPAPPKPDDTVRGEKRSQVATAF